MKTALVYLAFLATIAATIWIAARKAGRAEKELEYAKQDNRRQRNAGEILSRYLNLSSSELSQRVREKRETANKRMSSKD